MNVTLTPELEALMQRKIESGQYGDTDEIIRAAPERMAKRDRRLA